MISHFSKTGLLKNVGKVGTGYTLFFQNLNNSQNIISINQEFNKR